MLDIDSVQNIEKKYELHCCVGNKDKPSSVDNVPIFHSSRASQRRLRTETHSSPNIDSLTRIHNEELVDILVKYGNNPFGWSALHYATYQQDLEAVRILLENGQDPNQPCPGFLLNITSRPWILLFINLKKFDEKRFNSWKFKDPYRTTLTSREKELFKLFVEAGAQWKLDDGTLIHDVIISISRAGLHEMLWPFLQSQSEQTLEDVLCRMIELDDIVGCKELLSHGVNPDTALYEAIRTGRSEFVTVLLENGADLEYHRIRHDGGAIALAARSKNAREVIELLLLYGA